VLAKRVLPIFEGDAARNHVDWQRLNGKWLTEEPCADTARIVPSEVVSPVVTRLTLGKANQRAGTLVGKPAPHDEVQATIAGTGIARPAFPAAAVA
jgi:hypothetical protein